MKTKALKIVNLIVAAIVALFAVGQAFAWFINSASDTPKFGGSSSQGYYARGSGTQTDPYIINQPVHLYNLAWLQNNGFYDDGVYYFELDENLSASLDMQSGTQKYIIPPIGNKAHPFKGVFNGNGKTISNLKVSTNKNVLTVSASTNLAEYEFSNYVGFFGATAKDSSITNFILNNPTVEIADENETLTLVDTKYASGEVASDKSPAAGLAVGQVNGLVQSIGVNKGTLLTRKAGYVTFNSILGELGADIDSSVTGGGNANMGTGGSGSAFGASFDIETMLDRLYNIYEGKYGVAYKKGNKNTPVYTSPKLPLISTQNDLPTPDDGAKIAFSAEPQEKSKYSGDGAEEIISDQNVGYFTGNQNKFNTKTLNFIGKMTDPANEWLDWRSSNSVTSSNVPSWLYTYNDYISNNSGSTCCTAQGFRALTDEEYETLPKNIKDFVPSSGSTETFTTIRISYGGLDTQNYGDITNKTQWAYHGKIYWMGKEYGKGFKSKDGLAVDENGNQLPVDMANGEYYINSGANTKEFGFYTGGIALPNNAIWFKPARVGKFRFIMYTESDGDGFIMNKITRTNATSAEPFKVDPEQSGKDVTSEIVIQQRLPAGILFYYEYALTEEEVQAGNIEFVLQKNGSGGAHFLYLDIGSSAASDESSVVRDKVSAIDFVYDGVSINQEEVAGLPAGNFVVGSAKYEPTQASVYFELAADYTAVLALYFARGDASPYGLAVTVNDGNNGGKDSVKTSGNNAGSVAVTVGTVSPMYFS